MSAPYSISRRLTRMNLIVTGTALIAASLVLAAYDILTLRETLVRNLSIEAQIIGANSVSALVFDDPATGQRTLAALRSAPNVIYGGIYQGNGTLFVDYRRDPTVATTPLPALAPSVSETHTFTRSELQLARRVTFDDESTGIVFLRSDLQQLTERLRGNLIILSVVMAASFMVAFLVARVAQRAISQPIVSLAETAQRVSQDRRYSLRASVVDNRNQEIGLLVSAFNEMLAQIEAHDTELQTAHNELERRVADRTGELAAANKELESFSYSVSHDLRAPLRHVLGFTTLLQQRLDAGLDEQNRRYLKTIAEAADRMAKLIDDLLAFSRTSRTNLEMRRFSLDTLVREAKNEVSNAANGKEIAWNIQENLPDALADPALIRQVLVNLLSNAVKYSSTRDKPVIDVAATANNGEIVVSIKDNGVGFDMQYAHKLFGVFQRLHQQNEFEGTGIGLANVQRIVHRHGGRAWAESAPDRGATFYFSLPSERS